MFIFVDSEDFDVAMKLAYVASVRDEQGDGAANIARLKLFGTLPSPVECPRLREYIEQVVNAGTGGSWS